MKSITAMLATVLAIAAFCATASGQKAKPQKFTPKQIHTGAMLYEDDCLACHGAHMADPVGAFDLRTFPHDQHDRFVTAVSKGKNNMPAWESALKPEEIEALWAYVVAGEKGSAKDAKGK
jgi:mono/diheme cytochrome c family protein